MISSPCKFQSTPASNGGRIFSGAPLYKLFASFNPRPPVMAGESVSLALFYQALEGMFEHDRSAARGQMATRGLYVFKHTTELGNAHAHALFDKLKVSSKSPDAPARDFGAYEVLFDGAPMTVGEEREAAPGVTVVRRG